jgi:hypothetical protein
MQSLLGAGDELCCGQGVRYFAVRYTTLVMTDWGISVNRDISSSHPAHNISCLPRHLESRISPSALLFRIRLPTECGHRTSL